MREGRRVVRMDEDVGVKVMRIEVEGKGMEVSMKGLNE